MGRRLSRLGQLATIGVASLGIASMAEAYSAEAVGAEGVPTTAGSPQECFPAGLKLPTKLFANMEHPGQKAYAHSTRKVGVTQDTFARGNYAAMPPECSDYQRNGRAQIDIKADGTWHNFPSYTGLGEWSVIYHSNSAGTGVLNYIPTGDEPPSMQAWYYWKPGDVVRAKFDEVVKNLTTGQTKTSPTKTVPVKVYGHHTRAAQSSGIASAAEAYSAEAVRAEGVPAATNTPDTSLTPQEQACINAGLAMAQIKRAYVANPGHKIYANNPRVPGHFQAVVFKVKLSGMPQSCAEQDIERIEKDRIVKTDTHGEWHNMQVGYPWCGIDTLQYAHPSKCNIAPSGDEPPSEQAWYYWKPGERFRDIMVEVVKNTQTGDVLGTKTRDIPIPLRGRH